MYKIVFEKQALKDLEKLKEAKISQKAKVLVDIIKKNPYQNPPRYTQRASRNTCPCGAGGLRPIGYEKLVGNLDGLYSRRINIQHRLVYQVYNEPFTVEGIKYQGTIKIIRMWTHYAKI